MVTILFYGGLRGAVSDLAELPDWEKLNPHQKTITKEAFLLQLKEVYCPRESWWGAWIEIEENKREFAKMPVRRSGMIYILPIQNKIQT